MKTFAAAAIGALIMASSAQAATYDAFQSFNGTQGAGGFIYMKLPTSPGGAASLLTAPAGSCVVTSNFCLQDGSNLPGVYKSLTGGSEGTYTIPNDALLVHPGNPNPLAIFFRAPEAGNYTYAFSARVLDRSPTGVSLTSLVNLGGSISTDNLGFLSAGSPSFSTNGTITLAKDDVVGVIFGPAGNYANDSTGVNFTLSTAGGAVPEPAAWALMIGGFGMAGATLRRRRLAA